MAVTLSKADQTYLNKQQQAQVAQYKQDWNTAHAAGDTAGMQKANQAAEAVRASAGYSGGADGSGYTKLPTGTGQTAQQVQQWVDDYTTTNLSGTRGWINGYSTAMNKRSMANYIRQQMQANSDAWASADEAGKAYLHEQNKQLAQILSNAAGGVQSSFNEDLGRWETTDANLGYGYYTGRYKDQDERLTQEQMQQYRNDTTRYRNYVDQVARGLYDESSGYTGQYAQFVHGPYGQLLAGSDLVNPAVYTDLIGDGFGDEGRIVVLPYEQGQQPQTLSAPLLKNNNIMTDYTRQFASYVDENGIIQPGMLVRTHPGGGAEKDAVPAYIKGIVPGEQDHSEAVAQGTLEQWQQSAMAQAAASRDYAVDKAVQALLAAQAEAQEQYKTQRDQIAKDEMQALDNAALYAETRGDRGGIGKSQYSFIQAQAAANRQTVSNAQVRLASETAQQIAALRAQGEFEKADEMMEISQTYLLKLLDMEKWAAQHALDVEKFEESVRQWEQEFRLKLAGTLI